MFEVIEEMFTHDGQSIACYGLRSKENDLYIPAFSCSLKETDKACEMLNRADTNRNSLIYIIQDMVMERCMP